MKAAPITLLEYFATDLSFSATREFAPDKPIELRLEDFEAMPTVKFTPTEAEPRRWQVTLEIKHLPAGTANFPYSYRVVLVGFFRAEASVAPGNEERTIRIHGASVLYGMGREIVRALTGRGPHRPVLVPTVSFYDPPSVPAGLQS